MDPVLALVIVVAIVAVAFVANAEMKRLHSENMARLAKEKEET